VRHFEILRDGKRVAEGVEWTERVGQVNAATIHVTGHKPETLSLPVLMSRMSPSSELAGCELRYIEMPPHPGDQRPALELAPVGTRLTCFLYLLMRDELTPGTVARLVEQSPWHVHSFTNEHLEAYATEVANELIRPIETNGRKRTNASKSVKRSRIDARKQNTARPARVEASKVPGRVGARSR
jgi:hypothetical protein